MNANVPGMLGRTPEIALHFSQRAVGRRDGTVMLLGSTVVHCVRDVLLSMLCRNSDSC